MCEKNQKAKSGDKNFYEQCQSALKCEMCKKRCKQPAWVAVLGCKEFEKAEAKNE